MRSARSLLAAVAATAALAACGSGSEGAGGREGRAPSVVVTTSILGDVVREVVGSAATVTTLMPPGADPHDFQASAQQARAMREADLLVVNGGGFEEGLTDVVEAAHDDGVRTFDALQSVPTLERGHHAHGTGADHAADHGPGEHAGDALDPHFFADPRRTATAVRALAGAVEAAVPGIDAPALRARADAYARRLEELDAEVERLLAPVPSERRVLVTNHEVFGYFADRYRFEVVGAVIPGGSTTDAANAAALAELRKVVQAKRVPAIFADTSSPADVAKALAGDAGGVQVVELFSESLGQPGSGAASYVELVRTNATRIAAALA